MAQDNAYLEAKKRIEEARRSGARKLSLSGMGITELPAKLGQLTQLQILDLAHNGLTALPEVVGQLTQLQILNLDYNGLTALPGVVGQLTQLQYLSLANNGLTALPVGVGQLKQLQSLDLSNNRLTALPEGVEQLRQLQSLHLSNNQLTTLPEVVGKLTQLQVLDLSNNQLTALPEGVGKLTQLQYLNLDNNGLTALPEEVGQLTQLQHLYLDNNQLIALPEGVGKLKKLLKLDLDGNPLEPELAAAYKEGLESVKQYLRARAEPQVELNEAKLVLIGEGEVGKSALLGALRGDDWVEERDTTHGIEIKPLLLTEEESGKEITLNCWDFGGQRIYRPTHQLFFSAPAVYLVVWKPREGQQQGFVQEWIKLVKHRAPEAKILIVATHGGPGQRQPDIDRQEIWDVFGKDAVIDFFHVESKPDEKTKQCRGIDELTKAIARVAAGLPGMGRPVPTRWQKVRKALKDTNRAYLPLSEVSAICAKNKMKEEQAGLFLKISHILGHLIHYENDPALRDIVILKPDWLATAVSLVLDDKDTRDKHGLVEFSRLSHLWNDHDKKPEYRYPEELHPIFLRLMERFDLSYRVNRDHQRRGAGDASLIAQLVPDIRPEAPLNQVWPAHPETGDGQQVQICRIVDTKAQSAAAEGLFYQLIVRLHKYSLGRESFEKSVHWQRGLVLDDDYNGRALLEHTGNDIRITVRAPYPERFLAVLTNEVKWLVENFWEGLICQVMVPCIDPCGKKVPGTGLFEVQKLIAFKKKSQTIYPCPASDCDQAHDIDALLRNAPGARPISLEKIFIEEFGEIKSRLAAIYERQGSFFSALDRNDQIMMSKIDEAFATLMQAFTDEAKDGPRLFSFVPVEPGFFDRPKWISEKFRLTLWCEHSHLPLPALNGAGDKRGVYDLNIPRTWLVKAAPFLKMLANALSLALPVAASTTKLILNEQVYKGIEKDLDYAKTCIDSAAKGMEKAADAFDREEEVDLERGPAVRAGGAELRQLHAWLREKDPGFGGLRRVQDKSGRFFWVHEQFVGEY